MFFQTIAAIASRKVSIGNPTEPTEPEPTDSYVATGYVQSGYI